MLTMYAGLTGCDLPEVPLSLHPMLYLVKGTLRFQTLVTMSGFDSGSLDGVFLLRQQVLYLLAGPSPQPPVSLLYSEDVHICQYRVLLQAVDGHSSFQPL